MRTITTMGLFLTALAVSMVAADARGGHGFGRGGLHMHGMHGGGATGAGAFAADKRHADDPYIKAASDEEDRLLNSKLKSICRGC
ncbi:MULTISPECIES: hypothetical protein [unclassified Bradyrhizobium]|uniref:hypothetical protein n=1 Tax=unclassified Bradyrhizobium TaxID=2631580 RepID=UPI0024787FE1|nr:MULTISPECIES: hypothetical protein [unclassified Bradyrhizobium]WGS23359.1 hypothetical protein MTX22_18080 [Bradyrhizobium sp. ISRA463]WGS30372.1 hypothetical protein MTX19_15805 [Bradyrhizobium sp. ISRA464]